MTTENQDQAEEAALQEEAVAESTPRQRTSRRRTSASAEGTQEAAPQEEAVAESTPRQRTSRRRTSASAEGTQEAAPQEEAVAESTPRQRTSRRRTSASAEGTQEAAPQESAPPSRRRASAASKPPAAAPKSPGRRTTAAAGDTKAAEPAAEPTQTPARRRTRTTASATAANAPPTRRRSRAAVSDTAAAEPQPARSRSRRSRPADAEVAGNGATKPGVQVRPLPRLLLRLRDEIAPALMQEFSYSSNMRVPSLSKVVVNIGLGEALQNARAMETATRDVTAITGQRPVTTRAKKSIAGFKIREGMPIGLSVTLRGRRMYEFVDRLISSALPRIRDFQGVPRESFDGRGNYSLGIREQVIFPEIDYNSIDRIRGLQVVICTTARTDHEGLRLLERMGMPFARIRDAARVA